MVWVWPTAEFLLYLLSSSSSLLGKWWWWLSSVWHFNFLEQIATWIAVDSSSAVVGSYCTAEDGGGGEIGGGDAAQSFNSSLSGLFLFYVPWKTNTIRNRIIFVFTRPSTHPSIRPSAYLTKTPAEYHRFHIKMRDQAQRFSALTGVLILLLGTGTEPPPLPTASACGWTCGMFVAWDPTTFIGHFCGLHQLPKGWIGGEWICGSFILMDGSLIKILSFYYGASSFCIR